MTNKHGEFIWYELMTRDPEKAKAFYQEVVGWKIGERASGDVDYRMIAAGDDFVGGMFTLTDDMCKEGTRPGWLGYVGVEDVDSTVSKARELGGAVLQPAWDIPEVGRIAMLADPQGAPFYVMRGAVEGGVSTAFAQSTPGHCSWNELGTNDPAGALSFYGQLFGWENKEAMPMGDGMEYSFLDLNEQHIGAVSPWLAEGEAPGWVYYFYVPDIEAAVTKAEAAGGEIRMGPHEIPGGDYIIHGTDTEGGGFALVGSKRK